jgi:hypothetical protein
MREPPYEMVEITDDYQPEMRTDSGALWGDRHYDGVKAPDGTDISTRTKHREYMKRTGLTTADDFKETWAQAKANRERLFTEGGTFRRQDVERAIGILQNRR